MEPNTLIRLDETDSTNTWAKAHLDRFGPVSYTHLDVYKRQMLALSRGGMSRASYSLMQRVPYHAPPQLVKNNHIAPSLFRTVFEFCTIFFAVGGKRSPLCGKKEPFCGKLCLFCGKLGPFGAEYYEMMKFG